MRTLPRGESLSLLAFPTSPSASTTSSAKRSYTGYTALRRGGNACALLSA